jgi:hypothetical protein
LEMCHHFVEYIDTYFSVSVFHLSCNYFIIKGTVVIWLRIVSLLSYRAALMIALLWMKLKNSRVTVISVVR